MLLSLPPDRYLWKINFYFSRCSLVITSCKSDLRLSKFAVYFSVAEAQSHQAFPKETTLSKQNIITKGRLRPGLRCFFFILAWLCCRPKAIVQASEGKEDGKGDLYNIKVDETGQCYEHLHFLVHNFISCLLLSPIGARHELQVLKESGCAFICLQLFASRR